jgi:hypothetical protein
MTLNKSNVPVKIYTTDVDSRSLMQLTVLSQLPFVYHHIVTIPDTHVRKGATVGSVILTPFIVKNKSLLVAPSLQIFILVKLSLPHYVSKTNETFSTRIPRFIS